MSEYRRKRQQRFGSELKALRTGAGMSGREVADQAGTDQSTVSRIETGRIRPSHELLSRLLDVYAADSSTQARLAAELTQLDVGVSSWRWLEAQQEPRQTYIRDHEYEARKRSGYHLVVLPGLLQTAEYAEEVIRASPTIEPEQVPEGVALRMQRQRILFEEHRYFGFVITERALRRSFGSPELMVAQYERLLHLSTYPTIDIAVLPDDVPSPVVPHEFTIFDDSLVYIDMLTRPDIVSEALDVQSYISAYQDLVAPSLRGDEAREVIKRVIEAVR